MSMLVSVIVPIYNVEKYLEKCIQSIQNQSFQNLEIILVNDGSLDKSRAIAEKYVTEDHRVILINQENGGLSCARNSGIKIAKGDYLTFIDSDDTVDQKFIENLTDLINKYKTKIAVTLFKHVKEDSVNNFDNSSLVSQHLSQKDALLTMFYQNLFDNNATVKLFHRSLFENIVFPNGLLYEDLLTTYKLILQSSDGVAFAPSQNYNYLLRDDSIEGSPFNEKKYLSLEYIIQDLEALKAKETFLKDCINCRIVSLLFHLLFETEKNSSYETKIFLLIKKYRFSVLKDKKARKKARLASLISIFGVRYLRLFYKFGKSRS